MSFNYFRTDRSDFVHFQNGTIQASCDDLVEHRDSIVDFLTDLGKYDEINFRFRESTLAEIMDMVTDVPVPQRIHNIIEEDLTVAFRGMSDIDLNYETVMERPKADYDKNVWSLQRIWSIHQLQRSKNFWFSTIIHSMGGNIRVWPGTTRLMFAGCREDPIPTVLAEYRGSICERAKSYSWQPISEFHMEQHSPTRLFSTHMPGITGNFYADFMDNAVEVGVNRKFHLLPGTPKTLYTHSDPMNWPSHAKMTRDEVLVNDVPLFVRDQSGLWTVVPYREPFDYEL